MAENPDVEQNRKDWEAVGIEPVPVQGELRFKDGVLQQYQWSYSVSAFDWYDVPRTIEGWMKDEAHDH